MFSTLASTPVIVTYNRHYLVNFPWTWRLLQTLSGRLIITCSMSSYKNCELRRAFGDDFCRYNIPRTFRGLVPWVENSRLGVIVWLAWVIRTFWCIIRPECHIYAFLNPVAYVRSPCNTIAFEPSCNRTNLWFLWPTYRMNTCLTAKGK